MSTVEKGPSGSGMIERIRNLLLQPGATFETIDKEAASIGGLYRGWVVPLAGLAVVCQVAGMLVFGARVGDLGFRIGPAAAVTQAVLTFALQLALAYVMALVIEALAPSFGGQKNRVQAFKVTAYGGTAVWLAGVFQIWPPLAFLGLLGLYSLFLYYRGLPILMKAPKEKALGYTALVVAIAVVLSLLAGAAVATVAGAMSVGGVAHGRGEITAPGGQTFDLADLEKSAKAFEEAGEGPPAIDPELLRIYLPEAAAGFTRTEMSEASAGAAGFSGSGVEGRYERNGATVRLSVTDVGSAAPLAAMARALNVKTNTESDGRYEKVGEVDGRMTRERYNRAAKHGEYSVLVGDRFMVEASGDNVSMEELKALVAAVDPAALENLARKS